jgi:hypothetical protein
MHTYIVGARTAVGEEHKVVVSAPSKNRAKTLAEPLLQVLIAARIVARSIIQL